MEETKNGRRASNSEGLVLENLTKKYGVGTRGEVLAVDDLSLAVTPGSFVTLLGPSGCGKTTTLRLIAGFEAPTSGNISLGARRMNDVPPNKRGMAMVFQNYALFPHMTAYDNIAYGLRVRKTPASAIRDSVEMVLHLMNLVGVEGRLPSQLSGGEQQRVALGRALVVQPKVLLFDEPLSNLDAKLRVQMRDEIRRLQRRLGITSIYVTHDQAEAMTLSDTIVVMRAGRVEQVGSPRDIYFQPASVFVADFVGEANFIKSRVESVGDSALTLNLWGAPIVISRDCLLNGFSAGDDVLLMIRPEAIRLVEDRSGFLGEICKATYTGPSIHYQVEMSDQLISVIDTNLMRLSSYAEGMSVGVQFAMECFHVLRGG